MKCLKCGGQLGPCNIYGYCRSNAECRRLNTNARANARANACRWRRERTGGSVYVIGIRGQAPVKVGHTVRSAAIRMSNMQYAIPFDLYIVAEVPGDEELERHLHRSLRRYRIRGEWYDLGADPMSKLSAILGRYTTGRVAVKRRTA